MLNLKNKIDKYDYLLVIGGILLLPVFLIGLIPLGIFVWRLGDKWAKHNEQLDREIEEIDREVVTMPESDVPMDSLDEKKVSRWV